VETNVIPLDQIDMIHRLSYLLSRLDRVPVLFYSPSLNKIFNWFQNDPDLTNIPEKLRKLNASCLVQLLLAPFVLIWEALKLVLYPLWLLVGVLINLMVSIIKNLPDKLTFKLKRKIRVLVTLEGMTGNELADNHSAIEQLQYLLCNPTTFFFMFMDKQTVKKFG